VNSLSRHKEISIVQCLDIQYVKSSEDIHSLIRNIQRKLISARQISEMSRWDVVRIVFMNISNDEISTLHPIKVAECINYLKSKNPDVEIALKKVKRLKKVSPK
jgi:hypothetical protein